ncbi:LAQU0S08e04720g1_1 [Lachancea quebecensis]|uniref:LAQU0S08e04720g1_1 n=1 Tax=Lachancea quebecensis TaxID=1654605 RepID=A0A0N7MLT9_9SACH|nr:LAQU0S08e04720g1_1 [Lachancea quebecensis]
MSKIVFKHQQAGLGSLSVAGNFTKWEIKPMVYNKDEGQWEFEVEPKMFENCELLDGKVVTFFKFIDERGEWFTDDNFAKEADENGNENNALYLQVGGDATGSENQPSGAEQEVAEGQETESVTPDPTPVVQARTSMTNDREESPVMITESDLEEDFHDTNNEDHGELTEARNHSADTSVSATHNPTEYKNFLQSIVFFFKNLFRRWFGMGAKQQESR